jgi:hypothetical protein
LWTTASLSLGRHEVMLPPVAHTEHPDAVEVAFSFHAVQRFRSRAPWRTAGEAEVMTELVRLVEGAIIAAWPPAWVAGGLREGGGAPLWAWNGPLAFPLAATGQPGRWLALTCLRRGS